MSNFDCFLDEFDNIIGIEKIGCIHVNDSKNILSSNKDRHENIGFGGTRRHLAVVVGERPVKAHAVTYFCNHFRSYSWVSAMTFLQTSISSMLSFSSL